MTYLLDKNKEIIAKRIDLATLRKILYQKLGIKEETPVEEQEEDSKPE